MLVGCLTFGSDTQKNSPYPAEAHQTGETPGDALLVGSADGYEPVRDDEPPRDRLELFAFHYHILEGPASASCNERTTSAPSPTADATRFVEPLRTSPMAKTSGRVVSRSNGWPPLPSRCSAKLG
jgi:hypothetical protein